MNWDDLRFVLAVSRHGTLAGAGKSIHVDPTTVGRRILAIEEELGSRLFDRTSAGFIPTHTGEIAIAHAQGMELKALAMTQRIEGSDSLVAGPVRITALDGIIDRIIIPQLPRLLAQHPKLELTLSSDTALLDLSRREADIALRNVKPDHPDAVGRRIARQAGCAYAARDVEFGEMPPIISYEASLDDTIPGKILRGLFPQGKIVVRGSTEGHVQNLIRSGIGVGLLDAYAGDLDPGLRRYLPEPVALYDLWAVAHVDMWQAPRVREVVDFLTAICADKSDLLEGRKTNAWEEKMARPTGVEPVFTT